MKILAMTVCCVDVFPEENKIVPGGESLNLAVNCAKTKKAEVYLISQIGTDKYGAILKDVFKQYNINTQRVYEVEGQTANHIIYIDKNGDRYFKENAWTGGVWEDYKISESDKKFMQSIDVIATPFNTPVFKDIINIKKKSEFFLSVDFNDAALNSQWEKYFKNIDFFFISAKNQDLSLLEEWSKKYDTIFIATLGEYGSVAFYKGKKFICDAVKVDKVVDTTGCGDSYQGVFVVEYMLSKDIEKAMQKGSEAAAVTLSKVGGF